MNLPDLLNVLRSVNPTMQVIYDLKSMANVKADNVRDDEVVCVIYRNITGSFGTKLGYSERANIMVEFLMKSDFQQFESSPVVLDETKEICKGTALTFIQKYNDSGLFVEVDTFNYQAVFEQFDANFTGIMLTFTCESNKRLC